MKWIKKMLCKHEYYANSNIYGDMINVCNGHRTVIKCKRCGKYSSVKEFIEKGIKVEV